MVETLDESGAERLCRDAVCPLSSEADLGEQKAFHLYVCMNLSVCLFGVAVNQGRYTLRAVVSLIQLSSTLDGEATRGKVGACRSVYMTHGFFLAATDWSVSHDCAF